MNPRPGFVLEVDRSTPPTLLWKGEGFGLQRLPIGSRVIYAPEPFDALEDPDGAIRHALEHPTGDAEPLSAHLRPGMQLTICFDDISLPLPTMEAPDIRQMVIEAVLALSRGGAEQLYAKEIALEVNRLLEARGERTKLSPEKVGHRLRKLGLATRRLSQVGNGLVMDKETLTRLLTLSSMYLGEDWLALAKNLHRPQVTVTTEVEEVM